jgi:hypothetical protein
MLILNDRDRDKIEELKWATERQLTKKRFEQLISDVLNVNEYSFLDFSESDTIQLEGKEWLSDKWDNKLYYSDRDN